VLSAPAVRSRQSIGPFASAGLWFFRPHHSLDAGRPDLDRLQADRQPQDDQEAATDPLMLRQPRFDMGYGLMDLMDAAREPRRASRIPTWCMHGVGDRLCRRAAQGGDRSAAAAQPIPSSPSTRTVITC